MRMRLTWSGAGIGCAFAVMTVAACSSNGESPGGDSDSGVPQGDGGAGADVDADGSSISTCEVKAGAVPTPECGNVAYNCQRGGCSIDPSCGSTSTCLPMADNTGKPTIDLRVRKLNILAPVTFGGAFQGTTVTANIDLDATQCGEDGHGSFSWLLRVDRTSNTLTTGGAPPSADPFGKGYCYYRHRTPDGVDVAPITTRVTFAADTFTTSEKIAKLQVPIFNRGNVNNVIRLPLSDVVIQNATLSAGGNCVGSFSSGALDRECIEDRDLCTKWKTNAALAGYITLEEADNVAIVDLNRSLCNVLTGTAPGANRKCPRDADGKLALSEAQRGDFCSTSKQPGDCRDSFWFAATFAASAVKIHDGAGVAECTP